MTARCNICSTLMDSKCPFYRHSYDVCEHGLTNISVTHCDLICQSPELCPDQKWIEKVTSPTEIVKDM